jgi:hypothetical protein
MVLSWADHAHIRASVQVPGGRVTRGLLRAFKKALPHDKFAAERINYGSNPGCTEYSVCFHAYMSHEAQLQRIRALRGVLSSITCVDIIDASPLAEWIIH